MKPFIRFARSFRLGSCISAVAAVVMGLQVAGPNPAKAQGASQGKKVALLLNAPFLPFPAGIKLSFLERAKKYGFEVTTFEQNFDPARQAQQIDDAIARKFDMIAVMLASEQALIPALIRAKAANMPVMLINAPPKDGSEELYTSFVGEDLVEMGRLSGESMLKALSGSGRDGGKIALITGTLNEGVAPRRLAGIKAAIGTNPKVQIVAIEDAKWDPVATERIAGQLIARFAPQGGIDLMYGMNDDQTVAIVRAATSAGVTVGLKQGEMVIVGGNCNKRGIEMIENGKEYSTGATSPMRTGAATADVINDFFEKKPVAKFTALPSESITQANIAKWRDLCNY